ncbi:hypothetical protein GC102_14990 [Paenibacillus sp. LMG 31460]|uniref:TniQ protein n=1 Tax=Paenibacillus germinis TaxID=2654979 RepID=A0ABX1Z114_9BACL|nr:hypothetical protein [Paenibacillus germinis]NOU87077.1 hypothetical protein [Paenibacillus germinis]
MQERITWSKDWLSIYESPFSVYDKICYANVITQSEFFKNFGSSMDSSISFLLIRGLDHRKIESKISYPFLTQFYTTITNLSEDFLGYKNQTDDFFNKDLYYCNFCSLNAYHSLFFQFKFIKECPFHLEPLKNNCRVCNQPLIYTFYKSSSISQCCTNCNEPVLLHQHSFPNFKTYTKNEIKSLDVLDLLNMDFEQKQILKGTLFQGIKNMSNKQDLNFVLYCINALRKYYSH